MTWIAPRCPQASAVEPHWFHAVLNAVLTLELSQRPDSASLPFFVGALALQGCHATALDARPIPTAARCRDDRPRSRARAPRSASVALQIPSPAVLRGSCRHRAA